MVIKRKYEGNPRSIDKISTGYLGIMGSCKRFWKWHKYGNRSGASEITTTISRSNSIYDISDFIVFNDSLLNNI